MGTDLSSEWHDSLTIAGGSELSTSAKKWNDVSIVLRIICLRWLDRVYLHMRLSLYFVNLAMYCASYRYLTRFISRFPQSL